MTRTLKTLYPCRDCGAPAEVTSRREAEHAHCPRCRERSRLLACANYDDSRATKLAATIPEDAPEAARLAQWLEACQKRVEAARRLAEAVPHALPGERHLFVRAARNRAEWAADVLGQLGKLAGAALREETGLEPLDGGGEVTAPRLPELRLVGAGGVRPQE